MTESASAAPLADHEDLAVLRQEINNRFSSMERWIERCTTAIERLTDQRERVTVLEVRMSTLAETVAEVKKRQDALSSAETSNTISIAKLDMSKAAIIAIVMAVVSAMLGGLFHQLFGKLLG